MCGIAGLYHRDRSPVAASLLQAMTNAIAHRGPDAEGHWIQSEIGLGHRRLAIRDLSPSGAQPMHSHDGTISIVFNGEIYNDRQLKNELQKDFGFIFKTTCDTEVIPAGYQAWGMDVFRRLEGMFAIALWDQKNKKLILARDGIGIKPLFFSTDHNIIRFGSEIKALLADPRQAKQIDPYELNHFLTSGYPSPAGSLLKGIQQVPPGTVMTFTETTVTSHRFWEPQRGGTVKNLAEATEQFLDLFKKVVADHLISDVPLGVLQSGGIDSSLISLSLPKEVNAPLYCVNFQQRAFDESEDAARIAKLTDRQLHFVPAYNDSPEDVFRAISHHTDGQLGDASAFPTYLVCEAISKKARVALSGDGGDEFFAGYPTYFAARLASIASPLLPSRLWHFLGDHMRLHAGFSDQRISIKEKLARFFFALSMPVPHGEWRRYLYPDDAKNLYAPLMSPYAESILGTQQYAGSFQNAHGSIVDRALLADQNHYLPGDLLVKTDRMSMAHGLEIRVPFLDKRIMDFAGSLHSDLLLSYTGKTKLLLRNAIEKSGAPSEIVRRPKTGFNTPIAQMLNNGLSHIADYYLLHNTDIFSPYLNPDAIRKIWSDQKDHSVNRSYLLWSLLIFAVWKENSGSL